MDIYKKICNLLDKNNIKYKILKHEPVYTSEHAAEVRGRGIQEGLKRGAKAMILRSEGKFYQFIIAANEQLDFKKIRKILKAKTASFATPEEVKQVTGVTPGSVPPFGNLFNIPVYVDKSLLKTDEIDFNPGKHDISITMKQEDWVKLVKPIIEEYKKD